MIGTILGGRYRVVQKIGEGATSEIYLAEHLHIGRNEAIKVLRAEVAGDPQFVSRFRREARAINRVQHSNIIGIYDFGQLPDGRLYLAMEYGVGRTVDHLLRDGGRPPLQLSLQILHQLCSAVAHAHAHHVIHRDLKPANMMLVEHRGHKDVLKVLDFGLAKILSSDPSDDLTRQGQIFGTAMYMSPEQATGMPTDPRTDIYSIGCIAYELLTGRPPFYGNRIELIEAHLERPPSPMTAHNPSVPLVLETIVARAMAKDPNARYRTAVELATALEEVPGFPRTSGRSGRFNAGHTLPPERHEDNTAHSSPHENVAAFQARMGQADTASAAQVDVRNELYGALLEVAESMLDQGMQDHALMVSIGEVRALRDDAQRLTSQLLALEEREARIEQTAREREGSLRFAIGELSFDMSNAEAKRRDDLVFQQEQLELRLRELLADCERQLETITDERIDHAAAEARLEDLWRDVHERLQAAVGARLRQTEPDADTLPILTRYKAIEDALAMMA